MNERFYRRNNVVMYNLPEKRTNNNSVRLNTIIDLINHSNIMKNKEKYDKFVFALKVLKVQSLSCQITVILNIATKRNLVISQLIVKLGRRNVYTAQEIKPGGKCKTTRMLRLNWKRNDKLILPIITKICEWYS